jgi:protein arginine kinase
MTGSGDQSSLFPQDPSGEPSLALPELWLEREGPERDVVVSSRMRLARNLEGFHFKPRFIEGECDRLEVHLREVLQDSEPELRYHNMNSLTPIERKVMFERHLVSREHVADEHNRGVCFSADGTTSIMVNEEDHLRIQVFAPGLDLESLDRRVNAIDDRLGGRVAYSFDNRFGYRTSCPTNAGTGLRVSVMLHLPALSFRGTDQAANRGAERDIVRMQNAAQQLGLTVRGLFGESSRVEGDFYQISNQVTMGRSPEKTIQDVKGLVELVMSWERRNRVSHSNENRSRLEDHIWRSWAVLTNARRMASGEALSHLSALRLGVCLEIFHEVDLARIQSLMVSMRPAHLQYDAGTEFSASRRDEVRADLLRNSLTDN